MILLFHKKLLHHLFNLKSTSLKSESAFYSFIPSAVNYSLNDLVCSPKIKFMSYSIIPSIHLIVIQTLSLTLCICKLKKY